MSGKKVFTNAGEKLAEFLINKNYQKTIRKIRLFAPF